MLRGPVKCPRGWTSVSISRVPPRHVLRERHGIFTPSFHTGRTECMHANARSKSKKEDDPLMAFVSKSIVGYRFGADESSVGGIYVGADAVLA